MPKRKVLTVDERGRAYLREEGMDEKTVESAEGQAETQKAVAKKAAGGVDVEEFDEIEPEPEKPAADAGLPAQATYHKAKREWDRRRAEWIVEKRAGKKKGESKGGGKGAP